MTSAVIDVLLHPQSVALVGATATPGKLGERIVANLVDNGYRGRVYPVNPKAEPVRGVTCFPSVEAIPEPVDVGYVLVPSAAAAVEAVEALGRTGAKAAIVAAAGFAETATEKGRALEARLARIAQRTGIRVVGPNCNGVYNATAGISIGFNAAHGWKLPAGGMSVISHSGALFSTLMLRARAVGAGLSVFVSSGNECDLTLLDYMEYLVHDEQTRCIALLLDSLPDGARFERLALAARQGGKRVVALKLGTSIHGAAAAVAHSSRLTGRAAAYRALFEHCGVGQVDSIEALVSAAALIEHAAVPARPGLGVVAMSGGAGTLVADAAGRHEVHVPPLSQATRARLHSIAPGAPVVNPIDLGAAVGRLDLRTALSIIGADEQVHVVMHYYHPMFDDRGRFEVVRALAAGRDECEKPHVLLAPGGVTDVEVEAYRQAGILVLTDTDVALAALAAAGPAEPPPMINSSDPVAVVLPSSVGVQDDRTSIELATALGVPMIATEVVDNIEEALVVAEKLGWPLVLKGVMDNVAHKSEHGLVIVGIQHESALRDAAAAVYAAGAKALLLQPVVSGDLEALLGIVTEPGLGRFVVFGLGGVHTEALADTALVPAGAGRPAIVKALASTRLGAILRSARWPDPATFDTLVGILDEVSHRVAHVGSPLIELDVNPLVVRGTEIVGVDALAVLAEATP